jgi:hypothetical protein
MQNKNNTEQATTTTPDYGSYDSYKLTDEQIRQAVRYFDDYFLQGDGDEGAGVLCALLRSFTYTTDDSERETMLVAAESVLMPITQACEDALTKLAVKTHRALIQAGGTQ